ncbi:Single-strand DNA-binding [Candidatus Omnitrophus magneticus]|uniref:Single-stranded DNA-binding protein n=1 Tax=Candidatus Omnitrophus magneticus TaxID=1609969 RepID=A0A0F0CQF3_9BACT|nr:Single-strand DNA-binding [Candidatus Omnitrophus magneticus]
MAGSLNKVIIMGNLTRDPEIRYVPSGTAVTSFTVAVNRVYKDKSGEKKEDPSFIRVVVWGKMAEVCGEYLTKGRMVLVEGRLQSRSWETADKQKRSIIEVVAENVQFMGSKDRKDDSQGSTGGHSGSEKHNSSGPQVESVDLDADFYPSNETPNGGDSVPF